MASKNDKTYAQTLDKTAKSRVNPAIELLNILKTEEDESEEHRRAILNIALQHALFDGFTAQMLDNCVAEYRTIINNDEKQNHSGPLNVQLLFPEGIIDLLDFWSMQIDRATLNHLAQPDIANLKIREKITRAVAIRYDYLAPHQEAARRASATMALPHYAPRATQFVWRSADLIWRAIGINDTDYNFYSKRAILSGVITSTTAKWFSDDSEDFKATKTFLDARIENVMRFEKFKKQITDIGFNPEKIIREGIIPSLSKIRYPGH